MAKLFEKIYGASNRLLKEGEEIRAAGQFSSGWSPLVGITLAAIGGALACFTFGISLILSLLGVLVLGVATKFWYVSVTNQRVIFTQLSFWGNPDFNKSYSVPLPYARISENKLLVQPVSSDLPQSFHFYFGAKSMTGLDKSDFISALARSASDSQGQNIAAQPVAVQQPHAFLTAEQQEERQQRKRRNWGWAFVIGSGLFALIGICQTIGAIGYSFSPSAAEAVQKNGIIAIVAPLGCNGLWLVVWGALLGLSIKNLRSALKAEKQQPLRGEIAKPQLASNQAPPKNQPVTASSKTGQADLNKLCDELLVLLTDYLKREPKTLGRIREIGEQLNQEGGFELMRKVGYMVQAKDPLKASWLNNAWGDIGDWRS